MRSVRRYCITIARAGFFENFKVLYKNKIVFSAKVFSGVCVLNWCTYHVVVMDDVIELLKTWELHELIPLFTEHQITIQALAALTNEDLKNLIPRTGPRMSFTRCWRTWENEFSPDIDSKNASSNQGLDISNIEIEKYIHSSTENDAADLIFIPLNNDHEKEPTKSSGEEIELPANKETVATRTENVCYM